MQEVLGATPARWWAKSSRLGPRSSMAAVFSITTRGHIDLNSALDFGKGILIYFLHPAGSLTDLKANFLMKVETSKLSCAKKNPDYPNQELSA